MISENDKIEISGVITATNAGTFTVHLREIFVDNEWHQFSPVKEMEIAQSDYDAALTPQELDIVRELADKNKESELLTHCQRILLQSIVSKLKV